MGYKIKKTLFTFVLVLVSRPIKTTKAKSALRILVHYFFGVDVPHRRHLHCIV
jgi:hypothetical protein